MIALITGGAGFIHSNVVRRLNATRPELEVRVLDNLSAGFPPNSDGLNPVLEGSIPDPEALVPRSRMCIPLFTSRPSRVSRVQVVDPVGSNAPNASGTLSVYEAARIRNVEHVVVASSISVYDPCPLTWRKLLREIILRGLHIQGARVLIMGLTFKGNSPDLRDSRVADAVNELRGHGVVVEVEDPWADLDDAERQYGFELVAHPKVASYDPVVVAVSHRQYLEMGPSVRSYLREPAGVLPDVKGIFDRSVTDLRL